RHLEGLGLDDDGRAQGEDGERGRRGRRAVQGHADRGAILRGPLGPAWPARGSGGRARGSDPDQVRHAALAYAARCAAGPGGAGHDGVAMPPVDRARVEQGVAEALRQVYDPEIPVNIHELGLIYGVEVSPAGAVAVRMTLTAGGCPAAQVLPAEVERRVR